MCHRLVVVVMEGQFIITQRLQQRLPPPQQTNNLLEISIIPHGHLII
jgi:hypothetical protein